MVALLLLLSACSGDGGTGNGAGEGESLGTIKIGHQNWTADWPKAYILQFMLEDLGYDVEIHHLAIAALYAAMDAGDLDTFPAAWPLNQESYLEEHPNVEMVSHDFSDAVQGWAVPTWFAEEHGLEYVEDLNDPEIAALLDQDGDGLGDLMGCDAGWTCDLTNDHILEDMGLDKLYKQVIASESVVTQAIIASMEREEPVLFYRYAPDTIWALYPYPEEMTLLKNPGYVYPLDPDTETSELGWPPGAQGTAVRKSLADDHPMAYELLKQVTLPLELFNQSMHNQIVEEKTSEEELKAEARQWMDENEDLVEEWLAAARAVGEEE